MLEHALSLQAQREACEAFISSERHEGWVCLPASYDDGGFSGATMDRLALQRLLADITAGRVDIVVYKTEIACRSKNDPATGGGGRSHQGKMLVVGAVEVEDGGLGLPAQNDPTRLTDDLRPAITALAKPARCAFA